MKHYRLLATATSAAIAVGLFGSQVTQSQESGSAVYLAVSDVVAEHLHSIVIAKSDIQTIIENLPNANDRFAVESSSGLDGGIPSGIDHSHTVLLSRQNLIELRDTGTLSVESEVSLGHRHVFSFIKPEECAGAVVPPPRPSPSPSASPSPSPSPSVSPSPSPTVSPSPTGSPTASPTPTTSPGTSPPIAPAAPIAPLAPSPVATAIAEPS